MGNESYGVAPTVLLALGLFFTPPLPSHLHHRRRRCSQPVFLLLLLLTIPDAGLIPEPDEYRGFLDGLSLRHDRVCRKGFIRPAQRDAFHDDLIVGYSCVLAHHG